MDFKPGLLVLKSINLHFPGGICLFLEGEEEGRTGKGDVSNVKFFLNVLNL